MSAGELGEEPSSRAIGGQPEGELLVSAAASAGSFFAGPGRVDLENTGHPDDEADAEKIVKGWTHAGRAGGGGLI